MSERKFRFGFFECISLIALTVAAIALFFSIKTRKDTLSEVTVEERNSLTSPVLDEQTGDWVFVAIHEVSFTNEGSRTVAVEDVAQTKKGSGFLVSLRQGEIVSQNIPYSAYLVTPRIEEIRANPRLLRSIGEIGLDESYKLDLTIEPGETKLLRLGVTLEPYDSKFHNLVDMVLLSYEIKFSNGKQRIFRRGVVIPPIPGVSY